MNCNKLWTREILLRLFPKSFVNGTHKLHRENILFEREKSLFPATQTIVVIENRWEKFKKIKEECRSQKTLLTEVYNAEKKLRELNQRAYNKPPKKKFIRKCPMNECQGFLSSSWKCKLCTNHICKNCNEIKCEGHVCDPGNVETVKLLARDTKPCPSCGEMIFKASGCSQMWCTSCHAVFDWNTMLIEKGIIHNPHYYEYQRQHGTLARNPGDNPCGGEELPLLYRFPYVHYVDQVYHLCNHALHYNDREIRNDDPNLTNRKRFMKKQITECQFKSRIQQNEKHREKHRDVRNIMDMFGNILKDLLIQFLNKEIQVEELKTMTENLITYTNQSLRDVKKLYDNCVMDFINIDTLLITSDSKKQ
jgi:hypothetical protein